MNDPNEYVETARMSKLPLYILIGIMAILAGILVYSVNFSDKAKKEEKPKSTVGARDDKPLVNDTGGMGLATPPAPSPVEPKNIDQPQIVVVTSNDPPELRREHEELRRQKHQAAMNALSSPLVIRKGKEDTAGKPAAAQVAVATKEGETRTVNAADRQPSVVREGEYNPASDKDKETFFDRAKVSDRQWLSSSTRMAGQPFEIKTGSIIPAVMIGGINSDLPGQIIAQVSQNVFDTADGHHLLIPQGSKLYGVYDSRIIYGQSRVLVAWNRIIFPDGSAITLESMSGTDGAGFSGFNDETNNHYFRIFGNALLMSLITGGTAWAVDTVTPKNGTSSNTSPSLQQQMASALVAQLGQATAQTVSKGVSIKPTLEIRPGYRFNIVVTKDLAFREPYRDR